MKGALSRAEAIVGTRRQPHPMKIRIDIRYAMVTAASLAVLYWLSSVPGGRGEQHDPVLLFVENLSHAPLFAALAFAWHKTVTRGLPASAQSLGFAALAAGVCAVLDEWHQSLVPGRDASTVDLLVDFAGIATMLILLQWRERRVTPPHAAVPTAH